MVLLWKAVPTSDLTSFPKRIISPTITTMATCGYICPSCEGTGLNEEGNDCTWCTSPSPAAPFSSENEVNDWIKEVHEGPCCGDLGKTEEGI